MRVQKVVPEKCLVCGNERDYVSGGEDWRGFFCNQVQRDPQVVQGPVAWEQVPPVARLPERLRVPQRDVQAPQAGDLQGEEGLQGGGGGGGGVRLWPGGTQQGLPEAGVQQGQGLPGGEGVREDPVVRAPVRLGPLPLLLRLRLRGLRGVRAQPGRRQVRLPEGGGQVRQEQGLQGGEALPGGQEGPLGGHEEVPPSGLHLPGGLRLRPGAVLRARPQVRLLSARLPA